MVEGEGSWYVLIEEGGIDSDMAATYVEHVDGGPDRAREKALELTREHRTLGRYGEFRRTVFRVDENTFVVVLGDMWRAESFRVTVAELIHMQEAKVQVEGEADDSQEKGSALRRAFRRGK
jgi:hypothetical protein